uniref:Uncharacterized protein n=1 Tax=Panagrolaimus sp. ES5 TaxID=591445 RepID=A0AC34GY16_9BILA
MLGYYEKIKSVEDNDKEWLEALMEVKDEEFLVQNVEYRLGGDLTKKNLWKMYINFLKTRNLKNLLHTYSKYCRFWLDDNEMKDEYQKAAKMYGPLNVSWKNPFDFENYNIFATKEFLLEQNRSNICKRLCKDKRQPSSDSCFSFSNAVTQRFPFRSSLMAYIWKASNGAIRQKLFISCKYFFSKHPTPICYKLALGYNDRYVEYYHQQSVIVKCNYLLKFRVENFHVTTSLCIRDSYLINLLSSFIPKIYQCDVKFIEIWNQNLSDQELKFLMGSENVEELIFNGVRVLLFDETPVPLEDILILTPKIQIFND